MALGNLLDVVVCCNFPGVQQRYPPNEPIVCVCVFMTCGCGNWQGGRGHVVDGCGNVCRVAVDSLVKWWWAIDRKIRRAVFQCVAVS